MRSSPYRAGLAGRHPKRLPMPPALAACYGPVWLSPPGKPLTQEPVFRTPPLSERDLTLGDTAHVIGVANDHRLPGIDRFSVHLVGVREGISDRRFETVQGDGGEQRRRDSALRGAPLGGSQVQSVHDPCLEPRFDGPPQAWDRLELVQQGRLVDAVERAYNFLPPSMTHPPMR